MSCIAILPSMNRAIMGRRVVTGAWLVSLIALVCCNPVGDRPAASTVNNIVSNTAAALPPTANQTVALATNPSPSRSASDIPATNTPSQRSNIYASATNTPFPRLDPSSTPHEHVDTAEPQWDVIVLGWIDANVLSQRDPSPHLRYTRVLAGTIPDNQDQGQLAIVEVAQHLLPSNGMPVYQSQQQEVCFLKKVVVPGYEDVDVYRVVDVLPATPENMSRFVDQ